MEKAKGAGTSWGHVSQEKGTQKGWEKSSCSGSCPAPRWKSAAQKQAELDYERLSEAQQKIETNLQQISNLEDQLHQQSETYNDKIKQLTKNNKSYTDQLRKTQEQLILESQQKANIQQLAEDEAQARIEADEQLKIYNEQIITLQQNLQNENKIRIEAENLASSHRDVVEKMRAQLKSWQESVLKSLTGADYE